MLCRTYPSSFRSRLDRSSAPASPAVGCALIEVSCECGQLSLEVELQPLPRPLRCHCNRCRRFGTTAFAAFIPVAPTAVAALLDSGKHASFEDTCSVLGPVERRLGDRRDRLALDELLGPHHRVHGVNFTGGQVSSQLLHAEGR